MSTFWHVLAWACVAWYSTVTFLVAVRGWRDIVGMLRRLRGGEVDGRHAGEDSVTERP